MPCSGRSLLIGWLSNFAVSTQLALLTLGVLQGCVEFQSQPVSQGTHAVFWSAGCLQNSAITPRDPGTQLPRMESKFFSYETLVSNPLSLPQGRRRAEQEAGMTTVHGICFPSLEDQSPTSSVAECLKRAVLRTPTCL